MEKINTRVWETKFVGYYSSCCVFPTFRVIFPNKVRQILKIVVVPDSSAAQKVPAIDGLLEYRKDKQELYVRSNKTWNILAPENKVEL